MGIFSFFKNAGAKLFGMGQAPEPAAAAVTPEIQASIDAIRKQTEEAALVNEITKFGLNVQNLSVDKQGDVVIVYGQCETQADKEKLVLALGNVNGISSVDDRLEVMNPEEDSQFHEVKSGDTLSKIAKLYYGDAMKYPVIFEANKPMLTDPDLIYPGQLLRIPPVA